MSNDTSPKWTVTKETPHVIIEKRRVELPHGTELTITESSHPMLGPGANIYIHFYAKAGATMDEAQAELLASLPQKLRDMAAAIVKLRKGDKPDVEPVPVVPVESETP